MSEYTPPRSVAMKGINWIGRTLGTVVLRRVRLDAAWLMEKAAGNTGLSDFGDAAFREPLGRLLGSYDEEADLSLTGRIIAQQEMLRTLENRLRLIDDRKRYPEMKQEEIQRPLFVLGLPRTGSTILHEVLAQDPANRVPLTWELMRPSPPPEAASYRSDPRIAETARNLARVDQLIPGFRKMHPMGAELPQECCMLMNHDFMSMVFHTAYRVPGYQHWFERQEMTAIYASHRRQLQHLQFRCPPRRWVLKSPQHLWSLDALLAVYPDARIVQTHRDPLKVVASLTSLVALLRGMASDHVDTREIGRDWSVRLADGLNRTMDVRARSGLPDAQVFDLHLHEFMRDPIERVQRIYQHFDLELSSEAEARMRSFMASNPSDKHGVHLYSLREAGLDADRERERFEAYQKHHDIRIESVA